MDTQVIEKGFERVWQMFQETNKKFLDTDRKFQDTDKKFRESAEQLKKIENMFIGKWGRFMEVLIDSGAVTALRQYGLSIEHSASNVREQKPNGLGRGMEIDVLCWGKEIIIPIEVKTTLKVEDVEEQKRRLERFFECFPTFSGRKLYGAVAGLSFSEESDKYAYRCGLYVLTLVGENMVAVVNDEKFRPKDWAS